MLQIDKANELRGNVLVEQQTVAHLNARIGDGDQIISFNYSIANRELYLANREECREDIAKFQARVYEAEDEKFKEEGE